ncbi:hypothetical protein GCM10017596_23840 [Microbacterium keratanolyticum]|uniref:Uncharacterized protein n=2 Tax=Microbacterium keratanolyticum TaxID=67574 RepID=A0A9W6HU25_9MICO|nr:hypothetical protein GCM10017596_23840 [Microbacterium keratanolyticum]
MRAVIVLVNPRRLTIRQQPEDVTVLTSAQLTPWLGGAVRRPPGDADGRMEHPDPMIHAPALTA